MKRLIITILSVLLVCALCVPAFASPMIPMTGGIGTKIFYIVGGSMVIIALIVIFVRSRMSK